MWSGGKLVCSCLGVTGSVGSICLTRWNIVVVGSLAALSWVNCVVELNLGPSLVKILCLIVVRRRGGGVVRSSA